MRALREPWDSGLKDIVVVLGSETAVSVRLCHSEYKPKPDKPQQSVYTKAVLNVPTPTLANPVFRVRDRDPSKIVTQCDDTSEVVDIECDD